MTAALQGKLGEAGGSSPRVLHAVLLSSIPISSRAEVRG